MRIRIMEKKNLANDIIKNVDGSENINNVQY